MQRSFDPEIGRTNAILGNEQTSRVREYLADAQNELRQWHHDFAVLLARRPRIVDRVYRCKVALAPYKKLPVEITREIMLFAVGVPPSFPLPKELDLDPRLQITQVCADWRRIAFTIPELWKITLSRIPNRPSASKLIDAWWSQCSGSRLSLTVNKLYFQNFGFKRQTDGILFENFLFENIILPYSARLAQLTIFMGVETAKKMLDLPAGSFQALQTLNLTVEQGDSNSALFLDSFNTAFSSSPDLSKVALRGPSLTDPLLLQLPWQQLTRIALGLQVIRADLALLLLSYCPLLSSCVIGVISHVDVDMAARIASMPVSHLPNLTQLCLAFAGSLNHRQFLHQLSLPNLNDLTLINSPSHAYDWMSSSYSIFLHRARFTLTRFRMIESRNNGMVFGAGNPTDHHFDELLMSCMPRVETFEVPETFTISASTLEKIARGEMLPSAIETTFSVDNLRPALEMLEERLSRSRARNADGQTAISAITTAVVSCSSGSGMDDMIQGLKDQGINVVVKMLP